MQVPSYGGAPRVDQQGLPDARQEIRVSPDNFLGATAQAGLEIGNDVLHKANHAAAELYSQQVDEANRTRVLDAITKSKDNRLNLLYGQNGAFNQKFAQVFTQQNSKPLTDNVLDSIGQFDNNLANGLGNEEQRRMFLQHTADMNLQDKKQLMVHENEELQAYKKSTLKTGADTEARNIQLNFNQPGLINDSVMKIHGYTRDLAGMEGLNPDAGQVVARNSVSKALVGAIGQSLQHNDTLSAQDILNRFGQHMDANDLQNAQQAVVDSAARQLIMTNPAVAMDVYSRSHIENAILPTEGGADNFDKSGQPAVSADGQSIGRYQVTDATAQAPGFDIAPAASRTHAEYNRVGHELIGKLEEKYQGDPLKVAAAYNAGSGAVDNAITKGGEKWVDYLPASTRDTYLPRFQKNLTTGTPLDYTSNADRRRYYTEARSMLEQSRAKFAGEITQRANNDAVQAEFTGTANIMPLSEFQRAYPENAEQHYAEYVDQVTAGKNRYAVKNLSPTDQDALLKLSEPKQGAPDYAEQAKNYGLLVHAIITTQKQREADPVGFNIVNGNMGVKPINPGSPTLPQDLQTRAFQAQQIAKLYGTAYQVLSKDEAATWTAGLSAMPADEKAKTLKSFATALSDRGQLSSLLNQVAPDKPVTRMAAGMMLYPSMQETAQTVLKGEQILNRGKNKAGEDQRPSLLPLPSDDVLRAEFMSQIGNAYVGQGNAAAKYFEDAFQAVKAHYTANALEKGLLSADKTKLDDDQFTASINAVTGGMYEWGKNSTFVPWGMTSADFGAQLPGRMQSALKQAGFESADYRTFGLAALDANGKYQLINNGRAVPGAVVAFTPGQTQPNNEYLWMGN